MRLIGIAIKPARFAPMQLRSTCRATPEWGLAGDYNGSIVWSKNRQVAILSFEQWSAACAEVGTDLAWHTRRANLCVIGIAFGPEHLDKRIVLNDMVLKITGELAPCGRMEEACSGLRAALAPHWRGGITCRVLSEGTITLGDTGSIAY